MKTAKLAAMVCAGLSVGACANRNAYGPAESSTYAGPPPGIGTTVAVGGSASVYGGGVPAYGGMRGGKRCPTGTTPMGADGCAGTPVTDRSQLSRYDVPHAHCRPGSHRTFWARGVTLADGRRLRGYKINQTCRPSGAFGPSAAADMPAEEANAEAGVGTDGESEE